jgi:bacillithiol biosynthesis deacetylase BshB1
VTETLDLLAVAAHPDDAEVGCGGVLIQAAAAGLRTGVADLTAGERATRGTPRQRLSERDRATDLLGLAARIDVGLPDGGLGTDPGHRDAVIRLIREARPAIVLAPYPEDRHPDHAAAGRLVREGSFMAGVGRVGEGQPHRPGRVYHYMVHHPFTPSFVVDISAVWDRKVEVMLAYESQFGSEDRDPESALAGGGFLSMVEARARFHGAMIGVDRGEAFHTPGPVALGFLPGVHDLGLGSGPSYRMFH